MELKQIRVDGYKNLVNAVLELGDFNVLVGPNNSGKSNFLEAIEFLGALLFGNETLVKRILEGRVPTARHGRAVPELAGRTGKLMTIGLTFEIPGWVVDYEIKVRFGKQGEIVSEHLFAKDPRKPGPAKKYFVRRAKKLKVCDNEHSIALDKSAIQALTSLYPELEKLPSEFGDFYFNIFRVALTKIFCLSPTRLRSDINSENEIDDVILEPVASFDLALAADKIKKDGKHYKLFRKEMSYILDLEDVKFFARDLKTESEGTKVPIKRIRLFFLKSPGRDLSYINWYSDGTLVVAAILEALFSEKTLGPIFCIEEIENCLHPSAQGRLIRFLREHSDKWPVLLTTHSPYVLNCVNPEDVTVAVPDKTGAVHFEKIRNTKQLRDYLKSGFMSFGDMMTSNFAELLKGK